MLEVSNNNRELIKPKLAPLVVDLELPPWIDVIAFSSTTWEDEHERPRQLMSRCAKDHRVFFFQEPEFDACGEAYLELSIKERVNILIPHLHPRNFPPDRNREKLIGLLLSLAEIHQYVFYYFSPLAIESTLNFKPRSKVYDCMNEPVWLRTTCGEPYEICKKKLISCADLIFTTELRMCLDLQSRIRNVHLFADASNPKVDDWDALWKEMSQVIHRTLKGLPPLKNDRPAGLKSIDENHGRF